METYSSKRGTDSGASFSNTTINLSNNTGSSYNSEITTSGNNIYVVWSDSTTGNADIFIKRIEYDGATFSSPLINLSNNAGWSYSPPQITASGNNVYVVWSDSTTGNADIYFRRNTDGGATFSSPLINLSNNAGWSSCSTNH